MKIFAISDLHTDIWRPQQNYWVSHMSKFLKDVDVMVIAGDTGSFGNNLITLGQILLTQPHLDVVYVLGNHDYYGSSLMYANEVMTWAGYSFDKLHVLNTHQISWERDGVVFVGGTMWTNCNKENTAAMNAVQRGMNDYRAIHKSDGKPITTNNTIQEFYNTKKDIFKAFERNAGKTCIAVTHHQPFLPDCVTDLLSYGYCVDLEEELNACTNLPKYWIHGHTHRSTWTRKEYTNGQVVFVSNQFGYPSESASVTGYRNDFIIEV